MAQQPPPKLLDQVRHRMRVRHMARRTEEAYIRWIKAFLQDARTRYGRWIHPAELGEKDVEKFLTDLAVQRNVAASTQNQALSALLFLFANVLDRDIRVDAVRAKKPDRLPVVLSVDEVRQVLRAITQQPYRLMAELMYGAGLRLMECCRLRVKDVDFDRMQLTVREGKGNKDRMLPLPARAVSGLRQQMRLVRQQHEMDLQDGAGWVWLPTAIADKDSSAGRQLGWQYLFPAAGLTCDPRPREVMEAAGDPSGRRVSPVGQRAGRADRVQLRRHHVHETSVQKFVKRAVREVGIVKRASCHALRHSYS